MLRTNKSFEQIKKEQSRKLQSELFRLTNQKQAQITDFVKKHRANIFINTDNPNVDEEHLSKLILDVIAKNQHEFMGKLITAGLDVNIILKKEEMGAPPSFSMLYGYTPLMAAAHSGHVEMVKLLLSKKALCQYTLYNRVSPFGYAVLGGKVDVINAFLEHQLARNPEQGVPVLMLAIGENNYPLFKYLLSLKVLDINSEYSDNNEEIGIFKEKKYLNLCLGRTLIEAAIILNRQDMVDLLMQEGAKLAGANQHSALYYALHSRVPEMADKIIDRLDCVDARGFLEAIRLNKVGVVKRMLDEGKVQLDALFQGNEVLFFPLREAVKANHGDIINLLAPLSDRLSDIDISQAFSVLAEKDSWDVILSLRSKSQKAESIFKANLTVFLFDAIYGNAKFVFKSILEESGLNINEECREGFTPLQWAAMQGHYEFVLALLQAGANPDIKTSADMAKTVINKSGQVVIDICDKTALQLAVLYQQAPCVNILLRHAYPALHSEMMLRLIMQGQVFLTMEERFAFNVINELILSGIPGNVFGQEITGFYKPTSDWVTSLTSKAESADQSNHQEFIFKIQGLLSQLMLDGKLSLEFGMLAGFNQIENLYRHSLAFFKDKKHGTFEENISILEAFFLHAEWKSLFLLARKAQREKDLFDFIVWHPSYQHLYTVMQGFVDYALLKHSLFLKNMTVPRDISGLSNDMLESIFYVSQALNDIALYYSSYARVSTSVHRNQLINDLPVSFEFMGKEAIAFLQLGCQAAIQLGKVSSYAVSAGNNAVAQIGRDDQSLSSTSHADPALQKGGVSIFKVYDHRKEKISTSSVSCDHSKTSLMKAFDTGDDAELSKQVPYIVANNEAACIALRLIIQENKYGFLQTLLEAGLSVDHRVTLHDAANSGGNVKTAIMYAAELGRKEIVSLLLKSGAQVESSSFCSVNALGFAVKSGRWEVIQVFCDHGISLDVQQAFPLVNLAVYFGHTHLIEPLIKHGAPSRKAYAYQYSSQKVEDYCRQIAPELMQLTQINDCYPLLLSILLDKADMVSALVKAGVSVHDLAHDEALFFAAVMGGKQAAMRALADAGAIPCDKSFYFAARHGRLADIQLMFEKCKVVDRIAMQKKVLQGAISYKHVHIVKYLIEQEKALNQSFCDEKNSALNSAHIATDTDVMTPIMYAVGKKDLPIVNVLIDAGVDVFLKSARGYSLLYYAFLSKNYTAMPLLVKRGLDINERCAAGGDTILHLAAYSNHHELVYDLLRVMKANPDVLNDGGYSALQCAAIKGHVEFVNHFMHVLAKKDKIKNVMSCQEVYLHLFALGAEPGEVSKIYFLNSSRQETPYLDDDLMRFCYEMLTSEKIVKDDAWQAADKSAHFSEIIKFLEAANNLLSKSDSSLSENLSGAAGFLALSSSISLLLNNSSLEKMLKVSKKDNGDREKTFIYVDMVRSMWLHIVVKFAGILKDIADAVKGKKLKSLDNEQLVLFSRLAPLLSVECLGYQAITDLFYHSASNSNDQIDNYKHLIVTLNQVVSRANIELAKREQAVQKAKAQAEHEAILAAKKIQEEERRRVELEGKRKAAEESNRQAIELEKQKLAAIEEAKKQALAAKRQEEFEKKQAKEREGENKKLEEANRLQAIQQAALIEDEKKQAEEASRIIYEQQIASLQQLNKHKELNTLARKTVSLLDCVREAFDILQGIEDVYVCGSTVIAMLDRIEGPSLPFIGDVDVFGFNVSPESLLSLGFSATKLPNVYTYHDTEKELHVDFYLSSKENLTEEMKVRDLTVRSLACSREGIIYALDPSYFKDVAWRKLKMVGNPEETLDSIRLLHIMKYTERGFYVDPTLERCVEKWSISKDLKKNRTAGHFNSLLLKMLKSPVALVYVRLLSRWNKLQDLDVDAETPEQVLQALLSKLQPNLFYPKVMPSISTVPTMQFFAGAAEYVPSVPKNNRRLPLSVGTLFGDYTGASVEGKHAEAGPQASSSASFN